MFVLGWWALLVVVLVAAGAIGLTAFRYGLLPTLFGGAPYVPTSQEVVKLMLTLANVTPNDRIVDLGSGDGRLVIAAAEAGVKSATGYEIDAWSVHASRQLAKRRELSNAHFVCASFWKAPLHEVDVVFVYGLPPYMNRLANKCRAELASGARIVSLLYDLPGWTPDKIVEDVRFYTV